MRRFFWALLGGLGLGALLGRRRRTPLVASEPSPADELAAALAASRAAEEHADDEPAPAESGVEARRREIHERARRSADELR